jgi:hypothetical protein
MKVRVCYTERIDGEDLAALEAYHGNRLTREDLKNMLANLGTLGLEEQIAEGYVTLRAQEERNDAN